MEPKLAKAASATDECQVTPVIHVLQYPGCVPKPIPSFACIGRCASYIQVSWDFATSTENIMELFIGVW